MTIPFITPDVTPSWYQPAPSFADAVGPGLRQNGMLLMAMQKQKEAEQAAFAERQQQDDTGNILRDMLMGLGSSTVPSITPPGMLPTAPVHIKGPLEDTLRGRPGIQVLTLATKAPGALSQVISDAVKPKNVPNPVDLGKPFADENGFALVMGKDGVARTVKDEKGNPVKLPMPGAGSQPAAKRALGFVTNNGRLQAAFFDPNTGSLSTVDFKPGTQKVGGDIQAADKAGSRYISSMEAWRNLKDAPAIDAGLYQYLLSQKKTFGDSPLLKWTAEVALDDTTKRALYNYGILMKNGVYKDTGAQVNLIEFLLHWNDIPLSTDKDDLRAQKRNQFRRSIQGDWLIGGQRLLGAHDADENFDLPSISELWDDPTPNGAGGLTPDELKVIQGVQ